MVDLSFGCPSFITRALWVDPGSFTEIELGHYSELRERGVRLFRENRTDYNRDRATYRTIAPKWGCAPDSFRVWCQQLKNGGCNCEPDQRTEKDERQYPPPTGQKNPFQVRVTSVKLAPGCHCSLQQRWSRSALSHQLSIKKLQVIGAEVGELSFSDFPGVAHTTSEPGVTFTRRECLHLIK
jgi:hypothetical protein